MNHFQQKAFSKLWEQARAADPKLKHVISRPGIASLSCTCGWFAVQSQHQNAYARRAKLFAAERQHLLEILGRRSDATP